MTRTDKLGDIDRYFVDDPNLKAAYERVMASNRKDASAVNEALDGLVDAIGGPTEVAKLFDKFPQLTPKLLAQAYTPETLGKRVKRHRAKFRKS
jgi:hypothetical protein